MIAFNSIKITAMKYHIMIKITRMRIIMTINYNHNF